jgi:alcohol dehydrogenase class IV
MSTQFSLDGIKRCVFGQGSAGSLADEVNLLGGGPVLVVLDPGVQEAGVAEPALASLKNAGIAYEVYSEITREPEPKEADAAAEQGKAMGAKVVVGIGGGSALDLAKAAGVLITNEGSAIDYVGLDKVQNPGMPVICMPTTAGTGSEVTFTAVFTRRSDKFKGGINGRMLYPHTALLDPLLTVSCPPYISAITGMDALTHAMEAYTSRRANPISDMNALNAIELIGSNLRQAVAHGENLEARSNMLLGSYLAGLALAQAGVGAVHAMAYPLGAFYDIPHGEANALLLALCAGVQHDGLPRAVRRYGQCPGRSARRPDPAHGSGILPGGGVFPCPWMWAFPQASTSWAFPKSRCPRWRPRP